MLLRLQLLCQAFGLPLVEIESLERQGQDGGGINPPKVGDLEDAVGQLFAVSPSPSPKKPITAAVQREKSFRDRALTLPMGMAARRLT